MSTWNIDVKNRANNVMDSLRETYAGVLLLHDQVNANDADLRRAYHSIEETVDSLSKFLNLREWRDDNRAFILTFRRGESK